ncbi:hypothetical protein FRB99_004757 [Tulasnella sp. 403]|nr:hypothetical protein FRB99_004757 [Tulasnella sp. 403]
MATIARIYQAQFDRSPTQTLALTNGTLSAVGDICAQTIELFVLLLTELCLLVPCLAVRLHIRIIKSAHDLRGRNYDVSRTLRFIAFGVGMGPLIGRWNRFLETAFPLRSAGGKVSFRSLAKRVAADQTIMAPVGMALFVSSMGIMEGRTFSQVSQKYRDMFIPAMVANWKVWPAVQFVNFRFMPLPYRVPFQSSCGVFWTVYLSLLNANNKAASA